MSKTAELREDGLRRIRCATCSKTLAYASPDPVRGGKVVEIKCRDCNAMNYLVGQEPEKAGEAA